MELITHSQQENGNLYGFGKKRRLQTPSISEIVSNIKILHSHQGMPIGHNYCLNYNFDQSYALKFKTMAQKQVVNTWRSQVMHS